MFSVPVAIQKLDKMVAECMEDNDDVEITSDDENDPNLMVSYHYGL